MRRSVLSLVTAMALATLTVSAADTGTKYGTGVTVEKATAIGDLLKSPGEFMGKTVRVEGTITAVCEAMGCWMQLEDPVTKDAIKCQVDEGAIVFPVSAKGKKVVAQGTLERVGGEAAPSKMADHMAPGSGAAPHAMPKPATYQLHTTGAIIY